MVRPIAINVKIVTLLSTRLSTSRKAISRYDDDLIIIYHDDRGVFVGRGGIVWMTHALDAASEFPNRVDQWLVSIIDDHPTAMYNSKTAIQSRIFLSPKSSVIFFFFFQKNIPPLFLSASQHPLSHSTISLCLFFPAPPQRSSFSFRARLSGRFVMCVARSPSTSRW